MKWGNFHLSIYNGPYIIDSDTRTYGKHWKTSSFHYSPRPMQIKSQVSLLSIHILIPLHFPFRKASQALTPRLISNNTHNKLFGKLWVLQKFFATPILSKKPYKKNIAILSALVEVGGVKIARDGEFVFPFLFMFLMWIWYYLNPSNTTWGWITILTGDLNSNEILLTKCILIGQRM